MCTESAGGTNKNLPVVRPILTWIPPLSHFLSFSVYHFPIAINWNPHNTHHQFTMASSDALDVIILGGGIAGLTTALALTKFAPAGKVPKIRIFEIRPEPATIGGAVNLTPNALRMLDALGALPIIRERDYGHDIDYLEVFDAHSGKIAESSFRGPEGKGVGTPPYKALRITRGDALKGVLAAVEAQRNITMTCGKRTVKIEETADDVTLTFEDGETATADMLMGCDGIHSVTRLKHVEPERKATYSGVSNAFGFAPIDPDFKVHFECTAINFARRGMLLTSFHSSAKDSVYVGALMQVEDIGSRDGWKSVGADAERTRKQLLERFGDSKLPAIKPLIEKAQDFFLWPVFTLSKEGKWSTNRVMLLGDAAVSWANSRIRSLIPSNHRSIARHAPTRRVDRHRIRGYGVVLALPDALAREGPPRRQHARALRGLREAAQGAHRCRLRGIQERRQHRLRRRLARPHDQDDHRALVPLVHAQLPREALHRGCHEGGHRILDDERNRRCSDRDVA